MPLGWAQTRMMLSFLSIMIASMSLWTFEVKRNGIGTQGLEVFTRTLDDHN